MRATVDSQTCWEAGSCDPLLMKTQDPEQNRLLETVGDTRYSNQLTRNNGKPDERPTKTWRPGA